jgi:hypothetical protein
MNNGKMKSPGPYFSGHGVVGILFYFAIHIVYGATVGWHYARQVSEARQLEPQHDLHIAA